MRRRNKIALAVAGVAAGLAAASALSFDLLYSMFEEPPVLAQLSVGKAAPDFRLDDVNGRAVSLAGFRGKTVILEWNNPKCPTVKEHYESGTMQRTQAEAAAAGAVWLTINSSAKGRQGYMTPAKAKAFAAGQQSRRTAYLLDPEGVVGRSFGATTTPHMYVINQQGTLVYRGAVSGKPSGTEAGVRGPNNLVLAAISELNAGKPVSVPVSRPYGCSVKYKA